MSQLHVQHFISINEIPDAKSSQCILVMSTDNLKESAALSSSGSAEVETHQALNQLLGQRSALGFLQPLFETREPKHHDKLLVYP